MQQTMVDLIHLPIVRLGHYLRIPLETNNSVVFLKFGTYLIHLINLSQTSEVC